MRDKGWTPAGDIEPGDELKSHDGQWIPLDSRCLTDNIVTVYNMRVAEDHTYYVGSHVWGFTVWAHNTCDNPGFRAREISGPVVFGDNFEKKVRKHIDQVRNRGPIKDPIPSPGKGGIESVKKIILQRVEMRGGRETTYAGKIAVAYRDGGVTYIFKPDGEFWTILGN